MSATTTGVIASALRAGDRAILGLDFLAGGGEMGERTRALDWASTAAGPIDSWPTSLTAAVSLCLGSRHPMVLWWGQQACTQFYNDAYISFLGSKHPAALGQSARECWAEIWHIIDPMVAGVFATGEATWSEDLLLAIDRSLPREEGYFTFSYSPIRSDDGTVAGIFCACNETTARVLGERRLRTLRDLNRIGAEAKAAEAACQVAARILAGNPGDIPYALIYLLSEGGEQARLAAAVGLEAGSIAAPAHIDLTASSSSSGWPLARVLETGAAERVADAAQRFGPLPGGLWPEPSETALIVPIGAPGQASPTGFLVSGLSPRRVFDEDYRSFFDLLAGHLGTAVANARAYEAERRRAEALAEIDRAKTAFFSNVSHEFRTPLALMLGPLEEAAANRAIPPKVRSQLELASRNGLRLLKLVNNLLDFSRIEAGRVQACYEPTDIAALTRDLASSFRSAMERAGLEFVVECEEVGEPVYLDGQMWEKIVLNLLSNAFKFTLEGAVSVRVGREGESAVLEVADTGVGIPERELPRIFDRFHRVEGTEGRTQEGSGIGLALVAELVRLQGGSVTVRSRLARGTTFRVRIPFGTAHLPADRIKARRSLASTAIGARAFVQEALRWIPEHPESTAPQPGLGNEAAALTPESAPNALGRILLADDNADMRGYVRELLSSSYEVEAVADGEQALNAARRQRPELILCDIMMPRVDGLALLKALRADEDLRDVPVILLSARAGEEARLEGLDAGADDYLVKPFSARELLARVGARIELVRLRFASEARLREAHAELERRSAELARFNQAAVGREMRIIELKREVNELRQRQGESARYPLAFEEDARTAAPAGIETREGLVPLETVLLSDALRARAGRAPDYETENRVLTGLVQALADSPQTILQILAERALEVLEAGSAGLSLLTADGQRFYWAAIAGQWSPHLGGGTPRGFGPCGDVIDRNAPLLFTHWERRYPYLADTTPLAEEGLLVPLRLEGKPVGTLWVISHDAQRRFDAEDLRLLESLARFASAAYQAREFLGAIEQRRAALSLLEDAVQARQLTEESNARLKESEEALREADRRKDEFLALLGHELRNPIAPISAAAEVLSRALIEDTRCRFAIDTIKRQAAQLTRLVDDLLDVGRITQGRVQLRFKPLDLTDVITQAVETVEPQLREKQHRISIESRCEPLCVSGDSARLVQCVVNILSNAAKYTEPQGLIRLETRVEESSAVIEISDSGCGIAPELLPRVFDLFVQSDRTLDRAQGGLGIGLAVVKRLIEMHQGRVTARSPGLGHGSTFEIRLPRIALPEPRIEGITRQAPPRRVLIVDDNADAAEALSLLLSLGGHDTRVALSSQQALDVIELFEPHVALLDIGLPGMNGYELARHLRSIPRLDRVRLVALTGYGQQEDRQRALAAGFDDHLVKPVDFAALERTLAASAV